MENEMENAMKTGAGWVSGPKVWGLGVWALIRSVGFLTLGLGA